MMGMPPASCVGCEPPVALEKPVFAVIMLTESKLVCVCAPEMWLAVGEALRSVVVSAMDVPSMVFVGESCRRCDSVRVTSPDVSLVARMRSEEISVSDEDDEDEEVRVVMMIVEQETRRFVQG